VRVILPDKIRLGREYVRRASVLLDVSIILRTIGAVAGLAAVTGPEAGEPR
jgi:lipopolysaccharide/colanic/teichoic acid biosynthesis glycosyltransferase